MMHGRPWSGKGEICSSSPRSKRQTTTLREGMNLQKALVDVFIPIGRSYLVVQIMADVSVGFTYFMTTSMAFIMAIQNIYSNCHS